MSNKTGLKQIKTGGSNKPEQPMGKPCCYVVLWYARDCIVCLVLR